MSHHRCLIGFGLVSAFLLLASEGVAANVPDVHFAIFRLDFQTYSVKGVYEVTQSYRKTLAPFYSQQVGNLYFQVRSPGDFGYSKIYSRLTGQSIVYAETIWLGQGRLVDPPDSAFTQNYEHGHSAGDPTSILFQTGGWWSGQAPEPAWTQVQDTDVIERLAALGDYEVVVYDHFYRVGLSDPTTAEWFVIAFTNPPAPPDVGIEALLWPETLVTRGVAITPEIVLHNFSAGPQSVVLNGRIENGSSVVYDVSVPVGEIPADSSVNLTLPEWSAATLETHTFSISLRNGEGGAWTDTFGDNDQQTRSLSVTSLPIFRFRRPSLSPGGIPGGIPLDLEADGDIDFFHRDYEPKVYENEPGVGFKDITNRFPPFSHWAREAIASDLDGDGFPELLVADQFTAPPLLLASGGSQAYSDITSQSGLGGLDGWGGARVFDADQDGDQDLIMKHFTGTFGQDEVALFMNEGGHFSRVQNSGLEAHANTTSEIVPADLDDDGYPDLILVGGPSEVFRNDGSGHFSAVGGPWSTVTMGRSALVFDPDLDGDSDVVILARFSTAPSFYFENEGDMNFVDATESFGDLPPAFTGGVGDLDGNGYPDLVVGDIDDIKAVLLNEGGHFTQHSELVIGGRVDYLINVLDIDGDGDLDISNRWGGSYFENLGFDASQHSVGVNLTSLSARRDAESTIIEWSLAADTYVSDFQVYRSVASERLNISGTISGGRREYAFIDREPPTERTSYWVAEVRRTGGLHWFGPVVVDAAGLSRLALAQNEPNPFHSSTRITFSLPDRMPVRLSIYNVEGRKVRDLAHEVFPQGETAIYWDGRDQQGKMTSSGLYYYRLDAGQKTFTHRMIKIH